MVSERVEINIHINADEANTTIAAIQAENDRIARELAANEMRVMRLQKMGVRVARALMGLFTSLLSAFGVSLNAMGRAMLSVIDNIIALAGAWLMFMTARASGGDLLAAFGLGTAALALGISIGAAARVAQGVEEAEAQAARMEAVLSSVESLVRAPGRWGTF